MLLSAASLSSAAHSARRGRQQARLQRRAGGAKVFAAIQERRGSSPSRNREPEKKEDGEGINLFGKRVILRVEEAPEPEPFYDDEYDEPRRGGRRGAARSQEKEGNALDSLLGVFAKKEERDEDPYDRFVREERRERVVEREGRRSTSNRSPSPRREYVDDYDYDERPRSKNGNGNGNGEGVNLFSGLSALTNKAQDFAGEFSFGREQEERPRRSVSGSRDDAPRRRLVRRDEDDDRFYGDERDAGEKKGGLAINRRAAIAACLCGGCAVAAVRSVFSLPRAPVCSGTDCIVNACSSCQRSTWCRNFRLFCGYGAQSGPRARQWSPGVLSASA